jgi:glycosyltransferase involved in cell wall biosynthesis
MNIALDATPLTIPSGGVRRYVEELYAALVRCFSHDHYQLVSDQLGPVRTGMERRWWLWGLRRELERIGADLFHGTDFAVPYLPSKPSVMTLHDLSPWLESEQASPRVRRRTPLLLRFGRAVMVITPTEVIRRQAILRFGIAPDRIVAVPLAASAKFQPVTARAHERPYFFYAGTIEKRKNIAVVVAAWREMRKTQEVDLIIAGRVRTECDLDGALRLGVVPDEDLPGLYAGAAAVVYPSSYEGFGLPVLEAMQCGAMVITSKDAAIGEVAGGAAIQVAAHDAKGWLEAMRSALNQDVRAAARERGLRRAAEFSWDRTAHLTHEVYAEALRRS